MRGAMSNNSSNCSRRPESPLDSFGPSRQARRLAASAARLIKSLHVFLNAHWDHEPRRRLSRPSGTLSSTLSGGEGWGEEARFMESLLSLSRMPWDHEPLRLAEARSGARVCDPQQSRFMESGNLPGFGSSLRGIAREVEPHESSKPRPEHYSTRL